MNHRTGFLAALSLAAALPAGCTGTQRAAPVNVSVARDALKTTLEGWKKGDSPDALRNGSPPITAQDMDWLAGAKLVDYRVDGDGKDFGPNLHLPVKLTLRTPQGKEIKKSVSYVVGTSPSVTVFRALH